MNRATQASAGAAQSCSGSGDLEDASGAQHGDAVAERERLRHVVGDVDGGLVDLVEQVTQLGDEPVVERAVEGSERLVEQERAWRRRERAGEGDTLALATRERRHGPVLAPLEADERE